ncbi:MAG: hypothetical protein BGO11_10360 [Solirubrobacterales bacterium 70-9]|nr:MAG: hypothetical protein BGO11_10360 [Solirubrobacterales bacterium 70-9]
MDPLLAPVLQRRVESITKEMAEMLIRSSRSPIFNEIADLVAVVFDREGRMLGQTEYAAIIAFAAQPPLEYIIEYFGDDLADGDVIIHNDVYTRGNQNADVGIYVPIFFDGELVAWSACKGHVADIGGSTAGGYNPENVEIWQEAFRIPPLKIYEAGELRRDVWDLLGANIRLEIVLEDFKAMVGACTVGKRRLIALLERYGLDVFQVHMDFVLESSERLVRAELERWPDGVYHGESWMVSDGIDPERRYRIAVEVRIEGSDITFDFSGSDDQAPGFTNMPPASAKAATRIALSMLLSAAGVDVPSNDGLFIPVTTVFREGSLLNPRFPAASVFGNQMVDEVLESIMMALAEAMPDRVTAGWNQLLPIALAGRDPRDCELFVVLAVFQRGGAGAKLGADGWNMVGSPAALQMRSPDPEMFELTSPHVFEYCEFDTDSAGPGRWRGGLGLRSAFRTYGEPEHGTTHGDDVALEGATPPPGLFGGHPGGLNTLLLEFPDGTKANWGSKEHQPDLPPGTRVVATNGGGAGYGDPRERPAELVLAEVRDGLISPAAARSEYGVAIDTGNWTVLEGETRTLRTIERTGA